MFPCKKDCWKLKKPKTSIAENENFEAMMAVQDQPLQSYNTWVIDTGATSHMTYDRHFLVDYINFEQPMQIFIANGESIEASGKGSLNCKKKRL